MVSAIKGVNELVQLCIKHGVKHFVVSPGSRNAPFSITLEHTNYVSTYVVPDERSAGFFALGISLAINQPVALICTSGSAVLNYAPAVSEAYYQKIPLVVITADRPVEWINQGDGQTIMQDKIFGNHVLFSASLPFIESKDDAWYFNRLTNEALLLANGNCKGPVHLNVPFKEPLYGISNVADQSVRSIAELETETYLSSNSLQKIKSIVSGGEKVMFLIGQQAPNEKLNKLIELLANQSNVVVLTETTSNIHSKSVISTIDRCIDGLNSTERSELAPNVLVTGGGAIVSKKIKSWLRNSKITHHIHIGYESHLTDTYERLTLYAKMDLTDLLEQLTDKLISPHSNYRSMWMNHHLRIQKNHNDFVKNSAWSDFKAFSILMENLPECNLHLGNSSPVRYAQLFESAKPIRQFSNRGTSGIDGCTSTALGFAAVVDDLTVLITGDISFYYDSNALWNNYHKGNLRIVLINNKGGNIFRIIDGPKEESLTQKYFETKQELTAELICKQFNVDYYSCKNESELKQVFSLFMEDSGKTKVLEIFTDNLLSPEELKRYFNHLKEA